LTSLKNHNIIITIIPKIVNVLIDVRFCMLQQKRF